MVDKSNFENAGIVETDSGWQFPVMYRCATCAAWFETTALQMKDGRFFTGAHSPNISALRICDKHAGKPE